MAREAFRIYIRRQLKGLSPKNQIELLERIQNHHIPLLIEEIKAKQSKIENQQN